MSGALGARAGRPVRPTKPTAASSSLVSRSCLQAGYDAFRYEQNDRYEDDTEQHAASA